MKKIISVLIAKMAITFVQLFIPLLLALLVFMWFGKQSVEVALVRSNVDGREYLVQNKPDKQEAADLLARVRQRMIRLVDYLKQNGDGPGRSGPKTNVNDIELCGPYHERVERIVQRFDPDKISEGNEDAKYTSFTVDKGKKVVFCLRARGEGDHVHDLALMTFVAIHELAHIATISEHHSPEFQSNFAWLLRHAVDCGVYTYENFKSRPRRYCGIDVTDTPLAQ